MNNNNKPALGWRRRGPVEVHTNPRSARGNPHERHPTRTVRIASGVILGLSAAVVAFSGPAGALEPPEDDDPIILERPDLKVSRLSVAASGSSWSVSYTVANSSETAARASTISFTGGAVRSVPSIPAFGSASGSLLIPRADCAQAINAFADSGHVVAEVSELNNARSAVGVVQPCAPRYKVSAVNFKAVDESGYDWTGSDEPYWIFNAVSEPGSAVSRASATYGDVDTGDTVNLGTDGCIWGCGSLLGRAAPAGLGLDVDLWEEDVLSDGKLTVLAETAKKFTDGACKQLGLDWTSKCKEWMDDAVDFLVSWAEDDFIDHETFAYSTSFLNTTLPARGASTTEVRTFTDGDATYTLTIRITRTV
jgi:hypothetical protein